MDDILGELRAAGRLDSEGRFTLDTSRAEAAAIREIGSAEGALSPVGFGVIREALDPLLKELAAEHLTESVAWDYPVQQETNDAQHRSALRRMAAVWSQRLDALLPQIMANARVKDAERYLRGLWYVAQAETLRTYRTESYHASWRELLGKLDHRVEEYVERATYFVAVPDQYAGLVRLRIHYPVLDRYEGVRSFPSVLRFAPTKETSLPEIVRQFRASGAVADAQAKAAILELSRDGVKDAASRERSYELVAVNASDLQLRTYGPKPLGEQLREVVRSLGLEYCKASDLAAFLEYSAQLRGNGQRMTYLPLEGERDPVFSFGNVDRDRRPVVGFRWGDHAKAALGGELFLFRRSLA